MPATARSISVYTPRCDTGSAITSAAQTVWLGGYLDDPHYEAA
jgi:hypothetical protein